MFRQIRDRLLNVEIGCSISYHAIGGSVKLVITQQGDFTFSGHMHDSGFDNISFGVALVGATPSGLAFTVQQGGSAEGTVAGLPFGTPNRDSDWITSGNNPIITNHSLIRRVPRWETSRTYSLAF